MMQFRIALLLAFCMLGSACYAQVTMSEKGITFPQFFKEIRKQTGYKFIYNNNMLPPGWRFDVNVKNTPVPLVLDTYLRPAQLSYEIRPNNEIVIQQLKHEKPAFVQGPAQHYHIEGQVVDDNGRPLPGATVAVKGTRIGVMSGPSGTFDLSMPDARAVVIVSFVGYKPQEFASWAGNKTIQLQTSSAKVKEVIITTGMFNRNKTTFSGAVSTFTGKELRQVGTLNVLQSLKTLDPSFVIAPDNVKGSNPNQMPKIEVRGKTGLSSNAVRDQFSTDPNQPLFILNGMETTLQQIIDLDINRVASITLLKDAASTALYGSRAANGVVVVETIKPKPGELRVSYTAALRFEAPALRDYNMMNAAENLQFQRLAGLYSPGYGTNYSAIMNDNLYNQRLTEVLSGVNSYWLTVPLQNSFTNAHSLNISGGSSEFQYGIALNYRGLKGVMIGSDRKTWGANIDLNYRKGKLNVANSLYVNGTNADESPYGSFSDFVKINPYYRKRKPDGSLNGDRYLEVFLVNRSSFMPDTLRVGNPIYNARLDSKNNTNSITLQDQLNLIYDVSRALRFSGGVQVTKDASTGIVFIPAANTMFDGKDIYQKGKYTEARTDALAYQGNVMMTYRKVIGGIHSFNGNVRSEIQQQGQTTTAFSATGFPDGVKPNPAFAYGFVPASKPGYLQTKVRRVSALASVNYAYNNRFYVDATYRLDGSTAFGSSNKYSPFWSAGGGWNISAEKWLESASWLNILRVRANIGTTGNQSLGTYYSTTVFGYESNQNIFGQGLYISQLGNPDLQWQRTRSTNMGIDAGLWNNRLMAVLDLYEKYTNPLVVNGSRPASTGVSTYAFNVGAMRTKGVEANIHFSPIFHPERNVLWTLGATGAFYKSRYEGFSNILKNLNDEAQKSNSLQRYLDGYSPDELWAVRSLGIDPASGRELYRKKDGTKTFDYDPADVVALGDGRPLVQGVFSSNLSIKGFRLGIYLRYSIGQYLLNSALYNKVENISFADLVNNQDKRALELRWKQPGDQATFRAINISSQTPMSSRFIQRENYLSGESISAGYDMYANKYPWMHRIGAQTIRFDVTMNDIFRLSTIKSERGTDYPFSKALSFNLNLFF